MVLNRFHALVAVLVLARSAVAQTSPLDRLRGNRAGEIILVGMEAMGGWEAWKRKSTVRYDRDSTRYEADGRAILEKQLHEFDLPPAVRIRQETVRDGKRIVTGFDGSKAWVTEDGKPVTGEARLQGARNSSFGTQFMFCVPFKLVEEVARYEHLGTVKLEGAEYDKVRVTYPPGAGDNPDQIWVFYFNRATHLMMRADWSNAAGTSHSISEYDDFRKFDGLLWPARRTNYERKPDGGRGRKLTELVYRNIRFN